RTGEHRDGYAEGVTPAAFRNDPRAGCDDQAIPNQNRDSDSHNPRVNEKSVVAGIGLAAPRIRSSDPNEGDHRRERHEPCGEEKPANRRRPLAGRRPIPHERTSFLELHPSSNAPFATWRAPYCGSTSLAVPRAGFTERAARRRVPSLLQLLPHMG